MSQHNEKTFDLQFAIDAALCIQCGACVEDCPLHVIEMVENYPAPKPARARHCIGCQHCLAVCPTAAVSVFGHDPANSLPLTGGSLPAFDAVERLVRG